MSETRVVPLDASAQQLWERWTSESGPPVPVIIDAAVWNTLREATRATPDPIHWPRVFRLFMQRQIPRRVVSVSEILPVTRTARGIIRWQEGGYPPLSARERKGGNAFIRGDTQIRLDDAWWMAREHTDLRLLLATRQEQEQVSAWWARGGTGKSGSSAETDGEVWPVLLLIGT